MKHSLVALTLAIFLALSSPAHVEPSQIQKPVNRTLATTAACTQCLMAGGRYSTYSSPDQCCYASSGSGPCYYYAITTSSYNSEYYNAPFYKCGYESSYYCGGVYTIYGSTYATRTISVSSGLVSTYEQCYYSFDPGSTFSNYRDKITVTINSATNTKFYFYV